VATATAAIVLLTPANFLHFQRRKFNFQPLSFTLETFGKKQKSLQCEEYQSKKIDERLLN
jgi:hypothetical protein